MQPRRDTIGKKSADQEQTLLDLAGRLADGWCAVHVHLSRISSLKRNENIVFALQMFEAAVKGLDGRLLVMKGGDWFFFFPEARMASARTAIGSLQRLFSGDPLYYDEERYEADFATWYSLTRDRTDFLALARATAGIEEPTEAPPERKVELSPLRLVTKGSELQIMAQTIDAIERTTLASFLRRQPVCSIVPGGAAVWLFDEFYFSIADLEISLNRSPILTGDAIFLQYVTRSLDKKLLALLRPACQGSDQANVSVNLNVSSVLSPEFSEFDLSLMADVKRSIAFEFQFIDVFSDLGVYLYARSFLRERGYNIFLDGLTETNLAYVDTKRLGVDVAKLRWSRALSSADPSFDAVVAAGAPEQMVLCRCDSQEAIDWGHAREMTMFQGRYVSKKVGNQGDVEAAPQRQDVG